MGMMLLGVGGPAAEERPFIPYHDFGKPYSSLSRLVDRLSTESIECSSVRDWDLRARKVSAVLIATDLHNVKAIGMSDLFPGAPVVAWLRSERDKNHFKSVFEESKNVFPGLESAIPIVDDPKGPQDLIFETLRTLCKPGLTVVAPAAPSDSLIVSFRDHWEEFALLVNSNPRLLHQLHPRAFEELVAEIAAKEGFDVQLTQRTRDGGRDILAFKRGFLGDHLHLIECKRYSREQRIGVGMVRALYGVLSQERANSAAIVTTSSFSAPAMDFAAPLAHHLTLRDFDSLTEWIKKFSKLD